MKRLPTILVVLLLPLALPAQWQRAAIDTVFSFAPGTGQNSGQGPAVFPANIFGLPSDVARVDVPANDPKSVCSIGLGGVITIGWKGAVVVDGPGADFTIFENAFRYGNNKLFAEPGRVDVSSDGMHWISFPMDSQTFVGCAGMNPTNGDQDAWDPYVSGGDVFDLATIGTDSIRYVRITDVTSLLLNDPSNELYDPSLTGFDLDAVLGLHTVESALRSSLAYEEQGHVLHVTVSADDTRGGGTSVSAYATDGSLLWQEEMSAGFHTISMEGLPLGCSHVRLVSPSVIETRKVLR